MGRQQGLAVGDTHKILMTNQKPIWQLPYWIHVPPAIKNDMISELKELLDTGVVEQSTTE